MESNTEKHEMRRLQMSQLTEAIYDTSGPIARIKMCAADNVKELWEQTFSIPNLVIPDMEYLKRISFPHPDKVTPCEYSEIVMLQKRVNASVYGLMHQFDIDYWEYQIITVETYKERVIVRQGMHKLNELEGQHFGPVIMDFEFPPHRTYLNDAITQDPLSDCGC